jgi:DNA recombination protein RmuC
MPGESLYKAGMSDSLLNLAGAVVIVVAGLAVLVALALVMARSLRPRNDSGDQLAEFARVQADTAARIEAMRDLLAGRQADLGRMVNERLDSVTHHLSQSMHTTRQHTADSLQKLNERLVVIDGAQKNITELASQVTSLQSVLTNKQQRGAFGQGRMEIIVQDGLPKGCYQFQFTLSNNSRPDCAVFLPDQRPLVIDAKFPLEAVTAFRDAKSDDERKHAAARVRQDINRHVSDIAQKYLIRGETQDLALMFVPSESVYLELHDGFDDLVQKAMRAQVVIVSPALLMLAISVIQQIQKDARMREAADQIHAEVGHLMDDLKRMHERVLKLQQHFGQANEDVRQILISAEKVEKRATRIADVEFGEGDVDAGNVIAAPIARRLEAGG